MVTSTPIATTRSDHTAAQTLESLIGIDVDRLHDDLTNSLSVSEVAGMVQTTPATVARWISKGVPGADGQTHRLTSFRVGARKRIRRSDLQAFLNALNTPTHAS